MRSRTMTPVSRTHLRKLTRLSRREWADLLEAQLALLLAQFRVWTRPTGRLVSHSAETAPTTPATAPAAPFISISEPVTSPSEPVSSSVRVDPPVLSRAEALALAVGRAAEFGVFRPLCLVRAVALNRVLERHGISGSRVRVGVRMRNGRFAAHAWVEYGDRVLGDNEAHVGSFVELSEVRLVDAR
ncbi:MAG TPA: lasso peptide biosynthesis B2 protein [Gemmatimonadaceae bacterium]|nr:lasso peptide biosynthesis B2 protein [Gemmatimonadaceae bacterium]